MAKRRKPSGGQRIRSGRRPQREHRLNDEIRVPEVRLVQMEDESLNGIFSTREALRMAEEMELDLVEIAPNAKPPACRIIEYTKFVYDLKKKRKAAKANQSKTVLKEIRFGPNTDEHDFQFKLRHGVKFLEEGNKLKVYVQFRGRNIIYKERGFDVLKRFAEEVEDIAKVETRPRMEGRRMILMLAPTGAKRKPRPGDDAPLPDLPDEDDDDE
ncbi:MAG: translation initiation factor IF-3 [Bacteroidia bacterium]